MKTAIIQLAITALLISTPAVASAGCTKAQFTAAQTQIIPRRNINQMIFSEALLIEVNFARCEVGLPQMTIDGDITKAAAAHSKWMARAHKLTHTSNMPGQRNLALRLRRAGVTFKTAAENIARFNRFQFGTKPFSILDARACQFAIASGGTVPAHSYASLARVVVKGWTKSSGHRRNLLNPRLRIAGGGLIFDTKGDHCGHFYITQDYAG